MLSHFHPHLPPSPPRVLGKAALFKVSKELQQSLCLWCLGSVDRNYGDYLAHRDSMSPATVPAHYATGPQLIALRYKRVDFKGSTISSVAWEHSGEGVREKHGCASFVIVRFAAGPWVAQVQFYLEVQWRDASHVLACVK